METPIYPIIKPTIKPSYIYIYIYVSSAILRFHLVISNPICEFSTSAFQNLTEWVISVHLVTHPTGLRKWVSSPQWLTWDFRSGLIHINHWGELTHLRFMGWATKYNYNSNQDRTWWNQFLITAHFFPSSFCICPSISCWIKTMCLLHPNSTMWCKWGQEFNILATHKWICQG